MKASSGQVEAMGQAGRGLVGVEVDLTQVHLLVQSQRNRVVRLGTGGVVGATLVRKQPIGAQALARARAERQTLEHLAGIEGVPQLAETEQPGDALLLQDAGGVAFSQLPAGPKMPLEQLLDLSLALLKSLGQIHRLGLVHHNIDPSNILLGANGQPLWTGFSLAGPANRLSAAQQAPTVLEPAYKAPEQTGRTAHAADHRADLYAFGVVLYQWATGRLPFEAHDPLQQIHDILALVAKAPRELDAHLPQALSDIIMRLLQKEPERRYQSAQGLMHDLGRVRRQLQAGTSEHFELGQRDFAARLAAPVHLVGRQAELGLLRAAFNQAMQSGCRGVLVAGAPGVGKTMLINELRPLIAQRRGWFVSGKFDQYRQDLASDAVRQAFGALGRLLLAEPEAQLALLRPRILAALGPNAGLIAAINPEFALLLAIEPAAMTGDPILAGRQLVRAAVDLLSCIVSTARPLVMVLDDLQWAGAPVMAFFDAVLTDERLQGLFLVGAYRDGEIDAAHPLAAMMQQLGVAAAPVLALQNLTPPEQADLLAQMLRLEPQAARQLAQAIAPHSGGNPFDTVEVVNALRNDGVLVCQDDGWHWDEARVRHHIGSGEVIDLLSVRLRRMPLRAQRLIQIMACLGGEVQLGLLGVAAGLEPVGLHQRLAPALEAGLVQDGQVSQEAHQLGSVRFRHDRVQQAAYGLLTAASKQRLHLVLARRLVASSGYAGFATEQYLTGLAGVRDAHERWQVAQLFQRSAAGLRVVNPVLTERLLAGAIELLDAAPVAGDDDALRLALQIDRHAALYSLGRLEQADAVYQWIQARGDMLQHVDAACVQINSLSNRFRLQEAMALGLGLLGQLGLVRPQALDIVQTTQCLTAFAKHAAQDFERPLAEAPQVITAAKLLNRLLPPAYIGDQSGFVWVVTQAMRLWTQHGPCAELMGPVTGASFVSVLACGDYRTGYEITRHLLKVSQARGFEHETPQARLMFGFSAAHWFEPLEHSVKDMQLAREGLLHEGDLPNAYYTYVPELAALQECAPTLDSYLGEIEAAIALGRRTGNNIPGDTFHAYLYMIRALRGVLDAQGRPERDPDEPIPPEWTTSNPVAHTVCHTQLALRAAFFWDNAALGHHISQARLAAAQGANLYAFAILNLLQGLGLAEQARGLTEGRAVELYARLDECRSWLAQRAADAPFNFSHLVRWLDAERAWSGQRRWEALAGFEAALGEVAKRQRPWQAALIAERAGQCHLSCGLHTSGQALLALARQRYHAWGAGAKVRQLEQAYPFLRAQPVPQQATSAAAQAVSYEAIDLLGIVRACQALGRETSLSRLHARMVELLGEMTGATSVRIVLWDDALGQWRLPAAHGQPALTAAQAGERALLPLSVLRYVERTGELLVLDDALGDDRFRADPSLQATGCCSLLAVPILHQGAARAVLLLENRLSRAAFGAQRLDAVVLITGQLAVSLANVQLYENLEQRVLERTRELQQAQSQLLMAARKAGMAEIANNVLHNVGNVLNSVNISAGLVDSKMRDSKAQGLHKAVQLINQHQGDLAHFLAHDERGRLLPGYLNKLAVALDAEQRGVIQELGALRASVNHIKDIVATQQSYAGAASMVEPVRVQDLLDEALRMNADSLARHEVVVVKQVAQLPVLLLDKPRLLQILVNLIGNAKQAMQAVAGRAHRIVLRARLLGSPRRQQRLRIQVEDNGQGIARENLARLFVHGFTTRKDGHGFGLHSCALAAKEMGGTLAVRSQGPGRGAVFTLQLPAVAVAAAMPDSVNPVAQRSSHE